MGTVLCGTIRPVWPPPPRAPKIATHLRCCDCLDFIDVVVRHCYPLHLGQHLVACRRDVEHFANGCSSLHRDCLDLGRPRQGPNLAVGISEKIRTFGKGLKLPYPHHESTINRTSFRQYLPCFYGLYSRGQHILASMYVLSPDIRKPPFVKRYLDFLLLWHRKHGRSSAGHQPGRVHRCSDLLVPETTQHHLV